MHIVNLGTKRNFHLFASRTVLLLILVFSTRIYSQEPFPFKIGNQWEYYVETYFDAQVVSGSYKKMEIVEIKKLPDGKDYYRFSPCFLFVGFQFKSVPNDSLKIDCLRSDSGRVYYYSVKDSSEHLFFDSNEQYSIDSVYYFNQWSRNFNIPVNWGASKTSVKFGVIDHYQSTGQIVSFDCRLKGCIIDGQKYGQITEVISNDYVRSFSLSQNYPNPFNPSTTISYSIPQKTYVELKVYDLLGKEISTLITKEQAAGEYNVHFDGSSLPSGIYIYTIHAGEYRASRKLMLIK